MPASICRTCRYYEPYDAIVADVRATLYRCQQGVPDPGRRLACVVWMREAGADAPEDEA